MRRRIGRCAPLEISQAGHQKSDGSSGHVIVVLKAVPARLRRQVAFVGNPERRQLHVQSIGALDPSQIGRIATEELVPRPIQRVHVQRRRVLAHGFGIAVHRTNDLVSFVIPDLEIDGRRESRHDRKQLGVLVGHPQRALATHAGAKQTDAGRRDCRCCRMKSSTDSRT